jgi:hypothetical protein
VELHPELYFSNIGDSISINSSELIEYAAEDVMVRYIVN